MDGGCVEDVRSCCAFAVSEDRVKASMEQARNRRNLFCERRNRRLNRSAQALSAAVMYVHKEAY